MNARPDFQTPATLRRLSEIVEEYDQKAAAMTATIDRFNEAVAAVERGATIGGTYAGRVFSRGAPSLYERDLRRNLLESAWRHVYAGLSIDRIAPASDRDAFDMAFKDPAPFTLDNIRATFGKYLTDTRGQILRGLAECFSKLDPAFKSHERMKIGVQGLPKRIILSGVDDYGSSYGGGRLKDTINALRAFNGEPLIEWAELSALLKEAKRGDGMLDGLTLRRFKNGNAHLFFEPETLRQINRALAEYYGEVLPDCAEAAEEARRETGREVARDLQFYRTPAAAADALVSFAGPRDGMAILEPSCGDGAILDALRRYVDRSDEYIREENRRRRISVKATGVEVHPGRAAEAEAKGYSVLCRNFLEIEPTPRFDMVLMNPPFYGKHYQKHVRHALRFLKPGGRLYAILPVTAHTDHGFTGRGWDEWRDLPAGSFSESGTNINTGIARFFAPGAHR